MSKLKTTIPVDISSVLAVIRAMPKATVHEVTLEENAVVVEWDCDNIKTLHTFATDYPLQKLIPETEGIGFSEAQAIADRHSNSSVDIPAKRRSKQP